MRGRERSVGPPGGQRGVRRGPEVHLAGCEWSGGPSGGLDEVRRLSQRAAEIGRSSWRARSGREAHPMSREGLGGDPGGIEGVGRPSWETGRDREEWKG